MTLPQNVKDAVKFANAECGKSSDFTFDMSGADWQTIRAHLLSQEAEIERLQSRLAAANALLRDIKDWDVNQAQGTCLMVPLNLRKRIQAHLSENADVQP